MGSHQCCSKFSDSSPSAAYVFCLCEDGKGIISYDIDSDSTTVHKFGTAQLPAQAKCVLLPGVRLLIVGGRNRVVWKSSVASVNDPVGLCYLFDSQRPDTLLQRYPLLYSRYGHALAAHDNYAYALSGYVEGHKVTKSCERYNVHTDRWDCISPMRVPRIHSAVCCSRNKLYVTGGNSGASMDCVRVIEVYDIPLHTWAILDLRMPVSVWRHACTAYLSGIVVFGGASTTGRQNSDCFVLDIPMRRIRQIPWLHEGGEFAATVQVRDRDIYAIESVTGSMLCKFEDGKWTSKNLLWR